MTENMIKVLAEGEDYLVYLNTASDELYLTCRRCEWEADLSKLDTLVDIQVELDHHGDVNHDGTKVN